MIDAVVLFRPVGREELKLIRGSRFTAFPPRLPGQPFFYPVLNEEYAVQIARDWNAQASGEGYVTRFRVRRSFLDRYEIHSVGSTAQREYWIPAEHLEEFNGSIVGDIEVIKEFHKDEIDKE